MATFDLPLHELQTYLPEPTAADDFDEFWATTVAESRQHDLAATFTPYPTALKLIDTYDVTFAGFGGTPVKGWLHVPAGASGPLPTVVQYHGYSGGRGLPHVNTLFATAGYAQFVMDTRGQGWSQGGVGGTPDAAPEAGAIHSPGFMTSGLTDPHDYYYRRVYVDVVRALEAAAASELVDPTKIVALGGSQGGGMTIAAAGLANEVGITLAGAAPDVPFLCHFERALSITDRAPYVEITTFLAGWRDLVGPAYRTLSYVDGMNLARRATAPTMFSVALMDFVCPPSTVYAAYNHWGAQAGAAVDKQIEIYPHNGHEGGQEYQTARKLDWLARVLG